MIDFELLEAGEYYESLLKTIPKAKKRIVIAAMAVLWGERTAPIFIMLQDALKRGVDVTILLDNYTKLTYLLGLKPLSSGPERLRQTYRTLEDLSAQGAHVYNFGKIGFPPQKGRCHVKITVVDDISYSFGGVNFYDEMFDHTDYMLRSKSTILADCLVQLVERIVHTRPPLLDGEVELDKENRILFDGGRQGQSIIYEQASELTSQAKKVVIVSQMPPTGQLASLLNGVNASIYFDRPEQMNYLQSVAHAYDEQKYRVRNRYTGEKVIHAKVMLFEMPSGRKISLSGSHNFNYRGVSFGTQEICLYSTNKKLWDDLQAFIKRRVTS